MKSNKNNFFVRLGVICAIFLAIIFSSNVFADYEWATGGHAGTGGPGNSSGNGYYDCYSVKRCPRWILVPLSVYQQIKSQNRIVGSYTSLPSCENDKYLMIAGNQRDDGTLQIYNLNSGDRPLPYKEYHTYTSIASSISSMTNNVDWDNPDSTSFFSRQNDNGVKGDDGHILTYKEVLNEIIKRSGASEKNIAVACPSMAVDYKKLEGVPVDTSGNVLPTDTLTDTGGDGGVVKWWVSVPSGSSGATIGAGFDTSSRYSFIGWYDNISDIGNKEPNINRRYVVEGPLTEDKKVYAVYKEKHTLTGKSISVVDKSSLASVANLGDKVSKVDYNTKAEITRGDNNDYVFKGWKENKDDSGYSKTTETYTVNNLKSDKTVYAVYAPYRTLSVIAVVHDAECTEISKYNSVQKVEYDERAVADSKIIPGTSFKGWSFERCGKIESQLESYEIEHLTTDMVIYEIHSQPKLPCSDSYAVLSSNCDANLDIEQSKKSDGDWGKGELYMKPGDRVYLRGSYEPKYQDQKDRVPEKLKMASADSYENNDHNYTIEVYLNSKMDPGPHWNNAFSIMKDGSCVKTIEGTSGSNDKYFGTHNYTALLGKKAVAKAATNTCVDSQSTIKKIKYSYDYNYDLQAEIDNSNNESGEVVAYTPYNFRNEIEVTNEGENGIVFAGETKRINYSMYVRDRENEAVGATYHTKVEGAMFKLKLDYGDGTYEVTPATKFNINDGKDGNIVANIKDLPAGTEIYVSACVYPATSGYDENWTEKEGDKQWACSESKKFVVAKRPSLQVWGGGVYTNGNIATPSSVKSTLAGIPDYVYSASDSGDKKVAFGSWAEQAVVANGEVNGLASGAATGLNFEINGGVFNGIVESKNQNYCSRVPLSFANTITYGCPDGRVPVTGDLGAKHSELDRKTFIDYVIGDTNASITKLMAVNEDGSYSLNSGVLNDASLIEKSKDENGEEINSNTRVVVVGGGDDVMAAGTVVIDGNIQYEDNKIYTGLGELPKIIVYADNINIACNVTRIDAILIANNKVDTCPTYKEKDTELSPANDRQNSTQLVINGMIITNKLDLNRTYGAATGVNSGVPAEIVNYDTSTILWSMNQIDTDNYAGMSTVYQHEVAPRY